MQNQSKESIRHVDSSHKRLRVLLVEMPFGPIAWPSIGASLLKAQLIKRGHDCQVVYLHHLFLRHMGSENLTTVETYHKISDAFEVHLGEWIFAKEAFPDWDDLTTSDLQYQRLAKNSASMEPLLNIAESLRGRITGFIEECLACLDWTSVDVVGFSNSYSQLNASIAMARALRKSFPLLPMIIGGCGCSDVMGAAVLELTRLFRAAALGEADLIISDLVEAVRQPSDAWLSKIPGIAYRDIQDRIKYGPPKQRVYDMDDIPMPDYGDYYLTLPDGLTSTLPFYIPVESSRGCWWGEISHCTFCGLNPDRMAFHSKHPEKFLNEVGSLARTYSPKRFMAVDNIMPHNYYKDVVPALKHYSGGAEFFFEVKANFRRDQLIAFRDSNVSQLQPGIESLSTPILKEMGKGITGIANIYTLRLCEELGLRIHWSILYGFSKETLDNYIIMGRIIERIRHLRPPLGLSHVEIERFSPMFRMPEDHGLRNLRPSSWYSFCHPAPKAILHNLAYRFDGDYIDRPSDLTARISQAIGQIISEWKSGYDQRTWSLEQREKEGLITVQRRNGNTCIDYHLGNVLTTLYQELDTPRHVKILVPELPRTPGYEPYLDDKFKEAAMRASSKENARISLIANNRADAYCLLLLHGLIVEEAGMAIAIACHPADVTKKWRSPIQTRAQSRLDSRLHVLSERS